MLLLSPLVILLLNFVILTKAQVRQPVLHAQPRQLPSLVQSQPNIVVAPQPPQSPMSPAASNNLNNLQSQPPNELQLPSQPQPPTKPPALSMVQLTRSTTTSAPTTISATDSQEYAPTTNSLSPHSPIITIDVSQPPSTTTTTTTAATSTTTSTTQAPSLQSDDRQQEVARQSISLSESTPAFEQAGRSTTASLFNPSSDITFVAQASNIQPTFAQDSRSVITANHNTTVFPSSPIKTTTIIPPSIITDVPSFRSPQLARLQELKPTSNTSSVQILRPRQKQFQCKNQTDCVHGICHQSRCYCDQGFTGETCAVNVDECLLEKEPCFNNGTCIDDIDGYRCDCAKGFKGDRCQETVDMCVGLPCQNGAKCINHRTTYSCECQPGWEGANCEKNIDECSSNPCQNNGTCHDLIDDYHCNCGSSGFTGKNCEVNFDDCASKPCGITAKECIDLINGFKCVCHDGFQGERCEDDIDECISNPCQNNGTCVQNSLNLQHIHNLTDLTTIYHELKEQNLSSNLNMSQYAGYTCECKEEYTGDKCEEKKKCYTKSVTDLCNHQQAECVNVGTSYECLINASFDGSGQNYATYKVNGGFRMKEIHVKFRSLSGGTIMTFQINQPDSPIADLNLNKSGLYLSGNPIKQDELIRYDELLDGNVRDINLGLDIPIEIKEFTLTGGQSVMNDDHTPFKGCLMQVRLNNQLVPFLNYNTGLNGSNAFEFNDNHLEVGQCRTCFEKDCLNGGSCQEDGFDHCTCPNTFTGTFCEIDVDECEKNYNICMNGGVCENLRGGHRCNCKEGFKGDKCQEISDYCKAKQPCVTGTCKNVSPSQGTFQCECPSSHFGKRCETKRTCSNECHQHHAHCIGNITCACLPGKREERIMCEYVTSCEQVEGELCLNGGKCRTLETGGYECDCPKDLFFGPLCQFVVEKPQFDAIVLIVIICVGFLITACSVVSLVVFRSVRKARATRGTYSPSTQEKFGNSASDLLKPPQPERLI